MKVKASALFDVVRQVVREELQRALPKAVERHLSEAYLRRLVSESRTVSPAADVGPFSRSEEEEERVPEPLENEDQGIYANSGLDLHRESLRKLSENTGLPPSFYEDTAKRVSGGAPPPPPPGVDFKKMNQILEKVQRSSPGEMQKSVDAKMRELEARRKALEYKEQ